LSDGLPPWVMVVVLAETFGQLPDDVADAERGMSEVWVARALAWISERNAAQGGGRGSGGREAWPVVTPDAEGKYTL